MASLEGHVGQNAMSTNQDGTNANGRAQAFLTACVWAPRSANAIWTVTLTVKDSFETI